MTTNSDSGNALCEEILSTARKQSEEILQRAKEDAEAALAGAIAEAEKIKRDQIENAHGEAARRREMIVATIPVETGRMHAERVESLLSGIYEGARAKLEARDGFEYRKALVTLAAHAICRMEGDSFVVKACEADRAALGDGLTGEIEGRLGHRKVAIAMAYEPAIKEGGVVVEDADARQVWDNRLSARLERMWPELRRHLAIEASFIPQAGSGGKKP